MSRTLINLILTDTQLQAVDNAIIELETQLNGLIALGVAEKRGLKKMGEKSESFCRQALHVVGQNPQIVPPNVAVDDAVADLRTLDQLRPRMIRLSRLTERAADTDAALGNDIMTVSLKAYGLIKLAGRAEGLESLRKDLSTRFAKGPRQVLTQAA